MKAIPKVVHIIWIGGDIPERNRQCIVTFPRLNPDWEVNLWIDENQLLTGERRRQISSHESATVSPQKWQEVAKNLGPKAEDDATIKYLKEYLNMRGEDLVGLREQQMHSIVNFCKSHNLKLRTVQRDVKMGSTSTIYRNELVNRGANFGSASDILRIEILLQYGGIYVDTDVSCVSRLGELICHESYPRFSAVHPVWQKGVSEREWTSSEWWSSSVGGDEPPKISNSIIASHKSCRGLKDYKSLVQKNFKTLEKSDQLREQYISNIRVNTIQMTGPTAAATGSGFDQVREKMWNKVGQSDDPDLKLRNKLDMRDNWYFPMYTVQDSYFHDWL